MAKIFLIRQPYIYAQSHFILWKFYAHPQISRNPHISLIGA